jgi:isopentenyl-diphosphate delta-isomerase
MQVATRRRLLDELNIEAELEFVYKFDYQASFGELGSENELCHVYLGKAPSDIKPNESEISAIRFVAPAELDREFAEKPGSLTPWFRMEWQVLSTEHRDMLEKYADLGK